MTNSNPIKRTAVIGTLAFALLAFLPAAGAEGEPFRLESLDGRQVLEPSDLESGSAIIVFWAGWSPRCRNIVDRTNAIASEWGGRAAVLTVNFQESADEAQDFVGDRLNVPVFLDEDGSFSKQHTMTSLPGLLIYRDGEVAFRGKLPAEPDALIDQTLN